MVALTVKVLASLAQMHGGDATIVSDNQGVDEMLGTVQGQLGRDTGAGIMAMMKDHTKGYYTRTFTKGGKALPLVKQQEDS